MVMRIVESLTDGDLPRYMPLGGSAVRGLGL